MLAFLFFTVAISLSGVMAPGPITAATLAAGARLRHAGAMIAVVHAVVEIPLILLLVAELRGIVKRHFAMTPASAFHGGSQHEHIFQLMNHGRCGIL